MADVTSTTLQGRAVHDRWTAAYRTAANEPFYDAAFDWIASHIAPGATVLDAGCGAGTKTAHLARRGFRVTAADLSAPMLADAQLALRQSCPGALVDFRQADLTALPFASKTFAAVVCWGVLMHIPSVEDALRELCRVVEPGGVLIVSENNSTSAEAFVLRTIRVLRGAQPGRVSVERESGHERWEETPDGRMVTRIARADWLISVCRENGLYLQERRAAELTQFYAHPRLHPVHGAIHRLNLAWFHHVRWAAPAYGNLFVFRRT